MHLKQSLIFSKWEHFGKKILLLIVRQWQSLLLVSQCTVGQSGVVHSVCSPTACTMQKMLIVFNRDVTRLRQGDCVHFRPVQSSVMEGNLVHVTAVGFLLTSMCHFILLSRENVLFPSCTV